MRRKEDLHKLIDVLPEQQTDAAARVLEALSAGEIDPAALAFLLAPEDDEPLSEEDRQAVAEGLDDVRAGRTVPHEEVRRRLPGS